MSATLTKNRAAAPPSTQSRNPLALLRQEMDDLIAGFWNGDRDWLTSSFAPSVDLKEADNAFEIRMDIPGLESKDIDVQVHGNAVTISGQRQEEKEEKGTKFHRIERRSGSFSRTLSLPCNVNEDEVAAEYTAGVLTVKLPKCEEAKARKVDVKG